VFTADQFLTALWRQMRNDKSEIACARAGGALVALQEVGLLTPFEVEAWNMRFERCPGHEDEGGRSWCAYCGNL